MRDEEAMGEGNQGGLNMGRETKIDWADATWNPVTGCMHERNTAYKWGYNNGKA